MSDVIAGLIVGLLCFMLGVAIVLTHASKEGFTKDGIRYECHPVNTAPVQPADPMLEGIVE